MATITKIEDLLKLLENQRVLHNFLGGFDQHVGTDLSRNFHKNQFLNVKGIAPEEKKMTIRDLFYNIKTRMNNYDVLY